MENTKIELPCIPDDGTHKIATCEGLENFLPLNDNNYNNDYNNKAIVNDIFTIPEKFEVRTIVDNNPIASCPKLPSPVFTKHEEKIEMKKKKIFPFEIEDISKCYNIIRFPERIRREPREKKKYNDLANYSLVTIYLLFYADKQVSKRPRLTYFAQLAHEIIDAPMKSLKAKLSQIDRLDYMGENPKISYGLVKAFNEIQHMDPRILWNIIKNHNKVDALQEIKNLIKKDKECQI